MRFFNLRGELAKATRQKSGSEAVYQAPEGAEGQVDARRLGEVLRSIARRISGLEALSVPEPTEFELDVTDGGTYRLSHGYGSSVRYWVTYFQVSAFTAAPVFSVHSDTDSDTLVITSHGAGRVIVRVEPSQAAPTKLA